MASLPIPASIERIAANRDGEWHSHSCQLFHLQLQPAPTYEFSAESEMFLSLMSDDFTAEFIAWL